MGYRTYIAAIPKREYNKIKSMSREQLIEHYQLEVKEDGGYYIGMGVYDFGEALFNFGKYNDFNPPKKSLKTFFKNKELNKYFTDGHDFNVVTKEFLEYIIQHYTDLVKNYYNKMINPFFGVKEGILDRDKPSEFLNSIKTEYNYPNNKHTFDFSKITQEEQNSLFDIIEHVRSMRIEWVGIKPYNLKSESNSITTSWKYEYEIFELVRIYKSFDWKKNVMFYYGY